jgi:hypothetical protein
MRCSSLSRRRVKSFSFVEGVWIWEDDAAASREEGVGSSE